MGGHRHEGDPTDQDEPARPLGPMATENTPGNVRGRDGQEEERFLARQRGHKQERAGQSVARAWPGQGEPGSQPQREGPREALAPADLGQQHVGANERDGGKGGGLKARDPPDQLRGHDDAGGQNEDRDPGTGAPVPRERVERAVHEREQRLWCRVDEGLEVAAGDDAIEIQDGGRGIGVGRPSIERPDEPGADHGCGGERGGEGAGPARSDDGAHHPDHAS